MRCHCASDPGRAREYARIRARLGPGWPCRCQPTKLAVLMPPRVSLAAGVTSSLFASVEWPRSHHRSGVPTDIQAAVAGSRCLRKTRRHTTEPTVERSLQPPVVRSCCRHALCCPSPCPIPRIALASPCRRSRRCRSRVAELGRSRGRGLDVRGVAPDRILDSRRGSSSRRHRGVQASDGGGGQHHPRPPASA